MTATDTFTPDVIVVGAGLAGLVATHELALAGKRVLVLDQENRDNLGGQAWWSLGGLLFVDSPEQRRMGITDSPELAWQDWQGSAQFDRLGDGTDGPGRGEDFWPQQWARAYVDFAHREKRAYLHDLGLTSLPFVGWAERGDGRATGHGNSVPRFHLTWGTGPEVVRIFAEPVERAEARGLVRLAFRHQVDELVVEDGAVVGVRGTVLVDDDSAARVRSSRDVAGQFEHRAAAVVVTSGGIGHNHELMRRHWPTERVGAAPEHMISGVPAHVDGRMQGIAEEAGATMVNRDRMWAYVEGIHNWDPVWPDHAIRILPGPSSMWFDATGRRLEGMSGVPGADSIGAMKQILAAGHDYSWFVLTQSMIEKEFALSGSEQNPDITGKDLRFLAKDPSRQGRARSGRGLQGARRGLRRRRRPRRAGRGDERAGPRPEARRRGAAAPVVARDREVDNSFSKDIQVMAIHNARRSRTDRLVRVAKPHKVLDPAHGPLIAVRLNILSRKTLGGLETDLDGQCVAADGSRIPGLYAAGEVAGFGGGGVHGYNALEGTFLGGCIFSGRAVGRALAR